MNIHLRNFRSIIFHVATNELENARDYVKTQYKKIKKEINKRHPD